MIALNNDLGAAYTASADCTSTSGEDMSNFGHALANYVGCVGDEATHYQEYQMIQFYGIAFFMCDSGVLPLNECASIFCGASEYGPSSSTNAGSSS